MFPLIGGLLSGGASLLGSIFSSNTSAANTQAQIGAQEMFLGQSEEFNQAEAQKARDFAAQQSDIQRGFEAAYANSAYQRATADMKAAGINPILAAGGGQAATPSVSAASGPSASVGTPSAPMPQTTSALAGLGSAMNAAVSTAMNAKTFDKMTEEIANVRADQALKAAETRVTQQREATEVEHTKKMGAEADTAVLGLPGARFSAKQAEDLLSMPEWLRSALTIGGFGGTGVSKTISPITDLISGARDVRSLMPRRSTSETTNSRTGDSTFNERWDNLWR
jgi:hypothetical protein